MPSFDIVSQVDLQSLDNAINTAKKELLTRFDFRGTQAEIELDKKAFTISISTENEMKISNMEDILLTRMIKQNIEVKALDLSEKPELSGKLYRKNISVRNGLEKEVAKKITKIIKDSGLKVQPAIMDDIVRVTAKKIDDLQSVIALLRKSNLEVPLQFINMKS
jgi:cyclic-di-GMP-binding protein